MRAYSRSKAGAVFLFALLAGCATAPPSPRQRLSKQALVLDLPFEAQTAVDLCGVASVDMLTRYYKQPLSEGALQGLLDEARATQGVSGQSLKLALEEAGYFVALFQGTLDHAESGLFHHLDMKRPLLVMTGFGPRHFCVAVGYDEKTESLVLKDPAQGEVVVPWQEFMKEWKRANDFTLLAVPRKKASPTR